MNIMPVRIDYLQRTFAAYRSTGVSLVQFYDAGRIGPAAVDDDQGLYYIVPKIAALLGIPVARALDFLLVGLCLGGLAIGIAGLLFYCRTTVGRVFGTAAMVAVIALAARTGDVYLVPAALAVACVPWLLWFAKERNPVATVLALAVVGAAAAAANLIRSQAGIATLLFGVTLFLLTKSTWKSKIRSVLAILLGTAIVYAGFAGIVYQRDAYLRSQVNSYQPDNVGHPFWHTIYVGLGYLPNPYVAGYLDEVGRAKVRQIDPTAPLYSKRYEEVLRDQVIGLVREDPAFALRTVAAKALAVLTFFLLFANVGFLAAWRARKDPPVQIAFALALAFASLFGFIAVPRSTYLLGFCALSALWAAVNVDGWADRDPETVLTLSGPYLVGAALLAAPAIEWVYRQGSGVAVLPFQLACIAGWIACLAALLPHARRREGPRKTPGTSDRGALGAAAGALWAPVLLAGFATAIIILVRLAWVRIGILKGLGAGASSLVILAGAGSVLASYAVLALAWRRRTVDDGDGPQETVAGSPSDAQSS